jgi:hypothetical protein
MSGEETRGTGGTVEAKFVPFQIGDIIFGDKPGSPEPGPRRVSWKKKNRVVIHEIPGAKDKTQKTSVITLWTCSLTVRTLLSTTRDALKKIANEVGPFLVTDDFYVMQMYIMSIDATKTEAEDQQVYEWSIELSECND